MSVLPHTDPPQPQILQVLGADMGDYHLTVESWGEGRVGDVERCETRGVGVEVRVEFGGGESEGGQAPEGDGLGQSELLEPTTSVARSHGMRCACVREVR